MIKFEYTDVVGWEHAIRGMRNPLNSWDRSDSFCDPKAGNCHGCSDYGKCAYIFEQDGKPYRSKIGPNDHDLMSRLAKGGPVHAKYRRMIIVYVDITAPLYWWKEFDTYKVGTVANSCSTMHKIADKEFEFDDFSTEHLMSVSPDRGYDIPKVDLSPLKDGSVLFSPYGMLHNTIRMLNINRRKYLETKSKPMKDEQARKKLLKKYWWQMIQLLPSSYNQKRTIMMSYEVLTNIYHSRKNHKLDEWVEFCKWIERLPYSELVTGPDISEIDIPNDIMKEAERRIINRWVDAWNVIPLNSAEKDPNDFLNKKLNLSDLDDAIRKD